MEWILDDTTPTVSFIRAPDSAATSEPVPFEVSGSDADGGGVTYVWRSAAGLGSGSTYTTTFDSADEETVEITVTDDEGQTVTASTTVTIKAAGGVETAINCGGSSFTAMDGTAFIADGNYDGGATYSVPESIADIDDALYRSAREGDFSYDVPVDDGTYEVTLHFAELYYESNCQRSLSVAAEEMRVVLDYDIRAAADGNYTTTRETFTVHVTDGELNLAFVAEHDQAQLCGIEVASV